MGKLGLIMVVLTLLSAARCYNADLAQSLSTVPIVGAMVDPPRKTPAYVNTIGTSAASPLPETDFAAWFPSDPAADAYNPTTWAAISAYMAAAGTQAGWTEVCKKLGTAAGSDRAVSLPLGALGCSDSATVTEFQRFAVEVLDARAAVALWVKGAPGGTLGAIQGRQGEIRVLCQSSAIARQGAASPWVGACAKALDVAYLSGDGAATFLALGEAYSAAAGEIAKIDPTIDPEPGYFGGVAKK